MSNRLLNPRYQVILGYPGTLFHIGDILHKYEYPSNSSLYCYIMNKECPLSMPTISSHYVESYHHIFRRLPWYECLQENEMPEYVKYDDSLYKIGEVIKVKEWVLENEDTDCPCFMDEKDNHFTWVRGFLPATQAEYESYINKNNSNEHSS